MRTFSADIRNAIKQAKPFASLEHELYLTLQRLAGELGAELGELFRAAGLSGPQYNILRILRGAGAAGLPCSEVAERLVTKAPDVTRLLDRMEKRGWVTRCRHAGDRRVVTARITAAGLSLLAALDAPVAALHEAQFAHLTPEQRGGLLELLRAARARPGETSQP
ncbi:MarR family transcriptional regulator [Truepera radiovictrix]|nr:MarR family transcriptional regulator [Truepera radiovictrix]WMT57184.1 MarR family transcriptional regulator [Truepera radiovictrix]